MKSRMMTQLAVAAVLMAGVTGVMVAGAPSAAAIGGNPNCTSTEPDFNVTVTSTSISATGIEFCIPGPGSKPQNVTISKYIGNNTWQVVASGLGQANYTCTGGRFLYQTNIDPIVGLANFYCG